MAAGAAGIAGAEVLGQTEPLTPTFQAGQHSRGGGTETGQATIGKRRGNCRQRGVEMGGAGGVAYVHADAEMQEEEVWPMGFAIISRGRCDRAAAWWDSLADGRGAVALEGDKWGISD